MMRPVILALALLATSSHAFLAPVPTATVTRGRSAGALHMSGVERNPNFGKLVGGYVCFVLCMLESVLVRPLQRSIG